MDPAMVDSEELRAARHAAKVARAERLALLAYLLAFVWALGSVALVVGVWGSWEDPARECPQSVDQ